MDYVIQDLLIYSKEKGGSDIHITVGKPPMIRINGELEEMKYAPLMVEDTEELVIGILNDYQQQVLHDVGEVDFSFSISSMGRFRVNAYKQRGSYTAAIRLVDTSIPDPYKLGIPNQVIDLYNRKKGLILVTGPTGSGKSTTLASFIDQINKYKNAHIITLEDPIEYLHRHNKSIVNQREIGLDTKSYSDALRAALRQDPDVILIGEMRDLETISTAITAAETGHLVLSTLHTNSASSTIERIIDVFPPYQQQQIRIQLASVLEAVITQQLIPRADKMGRVAAFEVLLCNSAVRSLIRDGKTHQILSVMQTNRRIGMTTMDDAITKLYMDGFITKEQASYYASDEKLLKIRMN